MKNERKTSDNSGNMSASNSSSNHESSRTSFMRSLGLVIRYKWVVIGVTLTTTLVAVLIAFVSTPIYQGQGTLVMEGSSSNLVSPGSDLGNLLARNYGLGVGSSANAEVQLLKSKRLVLRIAEKLSKEKRQHDGRLYPILCLNYPSDSSLIALDAVSTKILERLDIKKDEVKREMVTIKF
ncbi:MAG: hypothetical protein HGB11_12950, partial [Chlorobiales bacterium]|nr:hypothetical protein [Chlorobiales bacterium]